VDTMSTANTLTSGLDCASPESIMEPTNRTPAGDQYSLGCLLYYCVTGRYPFPEGSAVEKMMAHQFKQPTPLAELAPEIPPELIAVIERLMQKKPEDRYVGIDETVEALHPLAGHLSSDLMAAPAPPPARPSASLAADVAMKTPIPARSTTVGTPLAVGSGLAPPSPFAQSCAPPVLPTRRSMRGEAVAATPPAPVPAAPPVQAPAVASMAIDSPLQAPPQNSVEPAQLPPAKPLFGPLGFLALGATVAVICFLAVHTLIK